ncbi:MAG: hypothetical protein WBF99_03385 [Xanthobacteraceae bacterium]
MIKKKRDINKETFAYFDEQTTQFEWLAKQALFISNRIERHITIPRKGYATWLFIRACIMTQSLVRLFTEQIEGNARYIDHAAIASLARALIENIASLLHYTDESLDDDEGWKCRQALINLHDFVNRESFLDGIGVPRPENSDQTQQGLQKRLSETKAFKSLPAQRQNRLLKGDDMYLHGRHQAMLALGWGEGITRAAYKYLSSHAHTTPLAFIRTHENSVYEPASGASRFTAGFAVELARRALGTGCLHMIFLFPYVELAFEPLVFASLKTQYQPGANSSSPGRNILAAQSAESD